MAAVAKLRSTCTVSHQYDAHHAASPLASTRQTVGDRGGDVLLDQIRSGVQRCHITHLPIVKDQSPNTHHLG